MLGGSVERVVGVKMGFIVSLCVDALFSAGSKMGAGSGERGTRAFLRVWIYGSGRFCAAYLCSNFVQQLLRVET